MYGKGKRGKWISSPIWCRLFNVPLVKSPHTRAFYIVKLRPSETENESLIFRIDFPFSSVTLRFNKEPCRWEEGGMPYLRALSESLHTCYLRDTSSVCYNPQPYLKLFNICLESNFANAHVCGTRNLPSPNSILVKIIQNLPPKLNITVSKGVSVQIMGFLKVYLIYNKINRRTF